MNIQILSDLHFEAQGEIVIPQVESDLIVLAGDIGEGLDGIHWALRQSRALGKPILYVFGNHEHYRQSFPGLITEAKLLCHGSDVHVLERNRYVKDGIRFLGCTLWTDFHLFGPELAHTCKEVARIYMPDYVSVIKQNQELLQPEDTFWLFEQSSKWLQHELDQDWQGKTVVATHHAPSNRSNDPRNADDPMSASFISNLDHLINCQNIDAWVHGHTHFNIDYLIRKTRVITNQRGYPGEDLPGNSFSPDRIFSI